MLFFDAPWATNENEQYLFLVFRNLWPTSILCYLARNIKAITGFVMHYKYSVSYALSKHLNFHRPYLLRVLDSFSETVYFCLLVVLAYLSQTFWDQVSGLYADSCTYIASKATMFHGKTFLEYRFCFRYTSNVFMYLPIYFKIPKPSKPFS